MITTSTPALDFTENKLKKTAEEQTPDFAAPSVKTIQNILNYSRNLEIKKSRFVNEIEVLKS